MKTIEWNDEKNRLLQEERGVCFEDVVICLLNNTVLDTIEHPHKKKYPNQWIFILNINDYVYLVPFVEDEKSTFLKTIIPSRKMTKNHLIGGTKKMKFSKEEKDILKSVKDGEWETIPDFESERKRYQAIAKNSLKKDQRINIRLASKDLMGLQKKAMREGLPYQTLISSVLHKYVTGQLKPAPE